MRVIVLRQQKEKDEQACSQCSEKVNTRETRLDPTTGLTLCLHPAHPLHCTLVHPPPGSTTTTTTPTRTYRPIHYIFLSSLFLFSPLFPSPTSHLHIHTPSHSPQPPPATPHPHLRIHASSSNSERNRETRPSASTHPSSFYKSWEGKSSAFLVRTCSRCCSGCACMRALLSLSRWFHR